MPIDWFTTAAQVINFLILVALLKRFLYRPVLKTMDERENRIRSKLREAGEARSQVEAQARELDRKHLELESERERMLGQAVSDAEKRRRELMEQARSEVRELESRWRADVLREQKEHFRQLSARAAREVCEASRGALADLGGGKLESRMIDAFLDHLHSLGEKEGAMLAQMMEQAPDGVTITSAFPVPPQQRRRISDALSACAGRHTPLEFNIKEPLICGIEMRAGGRKVAWSIENYLSTLEERVLRALSEDQLETEESTG